MGRKSKLTEEVQQRIVQAIQLGSTYELAAQYGGIHYDTFRVWMETKPLFSEAVKEAEGAAVVGWLAKIEKAANSGAWQAAAWKLERRYPHQYGRQVQEVQGSLNVEYSGHTASAIDREIVEIINLASKGALAGPPERARLPVGTEGEE